MNRRRKPPGLWRWALFLAALVAGAWAATRMPASPPDTLTAVPARVIDGDSFVLGDAAGGHEVRIAGIDAPEFRQPYGREARSALQDLIAGRRIELLPRARDRHGRIVADVTAGGRDVGAELVTAGAAWAQRERGGDEALLASEAQARTSRRGLWALPDPIAPWDWRVRARNESLTE
jgi:endonuclease YncB( thermonuclease family)